MHGVFEAASASETSGASDRCGFSCRAIIFAVIASNIHWQWTPNGYIPALLGIGLADLATLLVQHIMFKDFWRRS